MVIQPKIRGFICTTAHPAGCARHVEEQISFTKAFGGIKGPKRVLVVGSSTGYGLASRIAAAFGCGADTVGVFFEKPAMKNRTATAGWYNNLAFERQAKEAGLVAESVNGDAFSVDVKEQTIQTIRSAMPGGQVDLVVYSVAAPRRADPVTGESFSSVIKPLGGVYHSKTINVHTGQVSEVDVPPATEEEALHTVKVMGGEDWLLWMEALRDAGVLAKGAGTLSYSYIGPKLTHPVYKDGTIGQAKNDLEEKGREIDKLLAPIGGKAFVSVNKALVTQSSAAIPVVPLYISIVYKEMKARDTHEDCIGQMIRLFADRLYKNGPTPDWNAVPVDEGGRIRMDDWEMRPEIQDAVEKLWPQITSENATSLTDLQGYREDFYRLFGFGLDGVDYNADVQEF